MIKCRTAAELLSRDLDEDLSLGSRMLLNSHLWLCKDCRCYRAYLEVMNEALLVALTDLTRSTSRLSADARQRIKSQLFDNSDE